MKVPPRAVVVRGAQRRMEILEKDDFKAAVSRASDYTPELDLFALRHLRTDGIFGIC